MRAPSGFLTLMTNRPRLLSTVLIGVLSVCIPLMRRSQTVAEVVLDFQWVILFWFLLIPSPFPWYAVPLVSLLPIAAAGAPPLVVGVGLSGSLGLYYLSFFYEYHDMSSLWWAATKGVEHGLAWILLITSVVYQTALGLKRTSP